MKDILLILINVFCINSFYCGFLVLFALCTMRLRTKISKQIELKKTKFCTKDIDTDEEDKSKRLQLFSINPYPCINGNFYYT